MRVTIIGAGVFGAWCGWFLSERHRVTLIDAYGPANPRASSADHSRVIRCGYGADGLYSRWARASLDDWRALEARTGRQLLVVSGALFLGPPGNTYIEATRSTLTSLGIAAEHLDLDQLTTRYPQLATDGLGAAVFEPAAGVLRARTAVRALVQSMVAERRLRYSVAQVAPVDEADALAPIRLASGEPLRADVTVFACGPWLPALFRGTVGTRIRPTRQEVLHFGAPPGDRRFSLQHLPVWIDFAAGLYGVPDLDGRGFKVGIDRHGPPIDPDTHDRALEPGVVAQTRAWLGRRFPGLASAPLVDSHVCQYENTHSGDFLIDRHPVRSDVWIVGGGSGHGFKHGPAVGRYVTQLIESGGKTDVRFALPGKQTSAARSVF